MGRESKENSFEQHEAAPITTATNDEENDSISPEAIGGASADDLPENYFRSYRFIGSFIVGLTQLMLL